MHTWRCHQKLIHDNFVAHSFLGSLPDALEWPKSFSKVFFLHSCLKIIKEHQIFTLLHRRFYIWTDKIDSSKFIYLLKRITEKYSLMIKWTIFYRFDPGQKRVKVWLINNNYDTLINNETNWQSSGHFSNIYTSELSWKMCLFRMLH